MRRKMPWQKIVGHINGHRIRVESKSGNQYPVETKYDSDAESIYNQLVNRANDHRTLWAWVEFPEDSSPVLEDYRSKSDGAPKKPPWAHP